MTAAATPRLKSWSWTELLFVAPYLLLYVVFLVYPLGLGFIMSFQYFDLFAGQAEFIGLENYQQLFSDRIFQGAVVNTFKFVIFTVPTFVALGLLIALALNRQTWWAATLRTLFFASNVLSVTIVTLIWRAVYLPQKGLLQNFLDVFGIQNIALLQDPNWALQAIAVTTIWWGIGLPMVLFLAALQQIPGEIYEAAELDNASPWQTLWHITIPSIWRTVVLVTIIQIIAQFQVFGQINLMTAGGPNNSTRSMVQFVYEAGFRQWTAGFASAAAQVLFVIMIVAAGLQFWVSRRKQEF
ncbi:ABC transporter permease [Devosia geojensis]|uniref:ABC transporter permease n=2 Tax=Devosia geojensis TaxID=443610 RepID=A0A0F5FV12_9HYPH|nr:ABC transporter permease [Devosia geojensis]